jgi:hypothetical protein
MIKSDITLSDNKVIDEHKMLYQPGANVIKLLSILKKILNSNI